MDAPDIWMIVLSSLALVVAITSACFTKGANRIAKEANRKAKKANDISDEALGEAGRANEIAEDANHLSQEANAISKAQELRMTDKSIIDWGLNWDAKGSILTVEHIGRDTATDVSVLIRSLKFSKNYGPVDSVAQAEKVFIPLPEFTEIRNKRAAETARLANQGFFRGAFKFNASVMIQWTTPTGKVEWGKPVEIRLT